MNETVHRPIGRTQSSVRRICGKNSGKCGSADIDTPGFLRYNTRNVKYLYNIRKGVINILNFAGLKALEDELFELKVVKRQEVAQKIKEAREQGDLSENAEYDAAKDEQRDIEARIEEIEKILKNVEVVDEDEVDLESISIGCRVRLYDVDMDEEVEYRIVGSTEADSLNFKISNESPVGSALLGRKVGETIEVETQSGLLMFRILEIQRANI